MFKHSMTIPQFLEFEKLKKQENTQQKKYSLYTAIIGSGLCFLKTLTEQLGYSYLSYQFLLLSKGFFWLLISISTFNGIEKTCNKKTQKAGICQLVGNGISIFLMIKA